MADSLVELWCESDAAHAVSCQIAQIGEGEFELRLLRDGRPWIVEDASDVHELLDRARRLLIDLQRAPD